jgi:type I site-specific restriction-modification system R (restriction) subunit
LRSRFEFVELYFSRVNRRSADGPAGEDGCAVRKCVVDYFGLADQLKQALPNYTQAAGEAIRA